MIFQMTAKKVLGADYERLKKSVLIWAIVYWGLRIAEVQVEIAPFILYLMAGSFTAGVMWLTLSAKDNRANRMNLYMMPFEGKRLNAAYVSALGLYAFATKTLGLLCVVWAVSDRSAARILGSVLCAVNAVWMSACVYAWSKSKRFGLLRGCIWCGGVLVVLLAMGQEGGRSLAVQSADLLLQTDITRACGLVQSAGFMALVGNMAWAIRMTLRADAYAFYRIDDDPSRRKSAGRGAASGLVWRYLLRYMTSHRNYLLNTVILWGVACVLPVFLGRSLFLSAGFAIASMNTPICILLSCDPALEQAVRFLPGQRRAFFLPYGIFLFLCNMTAETVYLCSRQILLGGVSGRDVLTAVCFALLGAAGSALLEWHCPVRGWKTESDLWHHPRKYIVPGLLLLLAAVL